MKRRGSGVRTGPQLQKSRLLTSRCYTTITLPSAHHHDATVVGLHHTQHQLLTTNLTAAVQSIPQFNPLGHVILDSRKVNKQAGSQLPQLFDMSLARTAQSMTPRAPASAPRAPATPATPSTPAAQTDYESTPSGSWKHPKFDEIARRQYATTFDERNVRAIVANAGLLFLSIYGNTVTSQVKLLEYAAYVPLPGPSA